MKYIDWDEKGKSAKIGRNVANKKEKKRWSKKAKVCEKESKVKGRGEVS